MKLLSVIAILWGAALCLLANTEVRYAENFSIEDKDGYRLVVIYNAWRGAKDEIFRYALVPKGAPVPEDVGDAVVVLTPVERVVSMSTSCLAAIAALDEVDSVVGLSTFDYVNTPEFRNKIDAEAVLEVGRGASVSLEHLVMLDTDLVLTNAVGIPEQDMHPQLMKMGIPTLILAGYMESSPLGRAEWIKLIAAFYEKDQQAEAYFSNIEEKYKHYQSLATGVANKPTVFNNVPKGNVWYIPGGNSYVANLLRDAGADYLWADDTNTGPLPVNYESAYERALDGDIWINVSYFSSIKAMLDSDERFEDFKALRTGQVYNNNMRENEFGGNDYWERGTLRPDEVLADLIKLFHPTLLPEHELVYYQKLD